MEERAGVEEAVGEDKDAGEWATVVWTGQRPGGGVASRRRGSVEVAGQRRRGGAEAASGRRRGGGAASRRRRGGGAASRRRGSGVGRGEGKGI